MCPQEPHEAGSWPTHVTTRKTSSNNVSSEDSLKLHYMSQVTTNNTCIVECPFHSTQYVHHIRTTLMIYAMAMSYVTEWFLYTWALDTHT